MAGDEEKKKKKSSSSTGEKSKDSGSSSTTKEKAAKSSSSKSKASKSSSKDKSTTSKDKSSSSKDKGTKDKSSSSKDKTSSSTKDKASSKDKSKEKPAKAAPEVKRKPAPKPKKKKDEDYMAGVDLPPSSEEDTMMDGPDDEEQVEVVQEDTAESLAARKKSEAAERRAADKIRRKEQKGAQLEAQMRADALKDDHLAVDVSYEGTGRDAEHAPADAQVDMAKDIKVRNITVRVKGRVLLDKTDLTIAHGRRYCLVSPNGRGKSTLMRLIGQRKIPVPSGIDVLLVEQETEGDNRTPVESVVEADEELMRLRKEEKELTQMSQEDQDDNAMRMTEIFDRLKEIGDESAEARAAKILAGLGFTPVMQKRPTISFSGGWRMRISLARALFIEPTLLLLDEPTNHLDLRAALWLEEYLMHWKNTLIVVSHDRDFLDNVATDVIHLWNEQLHFYRGNFAQFQEMYEQRKSAANREYEQFEKELRKAGTSKEKKDKVKADAKRKEANKQVKKKRGEKREGMAAVEDVEEVADAPTRWNDYNVKFQFPEPTELPPPLLQIMEGEFSYPSREDFFMKGIEVGVDMGTRVAIIGPNGAGKSTLMNILAGDLKVTKGDHRRSHKLRIGRYSQHFVDVLSYDVSPVQYLVESFPNSEINQHTARALLGRFGLSGENHLKPIIKLSGGQKARVVFCSIYLSNPHILLLDEPTNNLDMESIDALSEAINEFEGGVVLISHDSRLITNMMDDDECRTEIWVVDDGRVEKYPGDFDDYRDELMSTIQAEQEGLYRRA